MSMHHHVYARCFRVLIVAALVPTPSAMLQAEDTPSEATVPDPVTQWPVPRWYTDRAEHTIACDNGILRVRPTKLGIIWFDVYHPRDKRWYVNKNNLNLMTLAPGSGWQNTELDHVQPRVEVVSSDDDRLVLRYHFEFPHGAKIYTDVFLERGQPSVRLVLHRSPDSSEITGFQWHVTFGQAEAVSTLRFDNQKISVEQLPRPFPGGREEVQLVRWFRDLKGLDFSFSGEETSAPDPSNPKWMTRVLGLKQHVTWGKPMRAQDRFAFEARNQPWQPDWGVPKVRPWIEGLWFVRNGTFPEGDELTFGIDNLLETSTRYPAVQSAQERTMVNVARTQLGLLEKVLDMYRLHMGEYPTTGQGLPALWFVPENLADRTKWRGPYLAKEIPLDPWGDEYQYEPLAPDTFRIWSMGLDGVSDTGDDITLD